MLLPALFLLSAFVFVTVYRTPRAVLRRYLSTFSARHGANVPISLAVLGTCCLSGIVASVVQPGHPLAEAVIVVALAALTLAGVADLRRFRRR